MYQITAWRNHFSFISHRVYSQAEYADATIFAYILKGHTEG